VPGRAFFGTIERGEGYIHILFLFFLVIGAVMIFKKKEWLSFFKLTLLTGIIISGDAILDFLQSGERPDGSFINNPAFISSYLLFAMFAAFVVLSVVKKSSWRYLGYLSILLSLAAIAVTNTRGVLVGLFVGVLAVAVYFVWKGGSNKVRLFRKDMKFKTLGMVILVSAVLLTSLFVFTIDSPVWDEVPGLNRLSQISLEDNTVQSRLITTRISFNAINPAEAGLYRLVFGYGPDNFNVAHNTYYEPSVQRYEQLWFDRAHNKLLDVLVMRGILGLLAYLAIWYFALRSVFRYARTSEEEGEKNSRRRFLISASALFFAAAYFTQNLFLFDHATTYIPVFMFWGFTIYLSQRTASLKKVDPKTWVSISKYASPVVAFIFVVLVALYSFVPLYQVSVFVSSLKTGSAVTLFDNLDSMTKPYNFAQPEIRFRILTTASVLIGTPEALPFIDKALLLEDEVLSRKLFEPRYFYVAGFVYDTMGRTYNRSEFYSIAEELFRKAIELSPGRQEPMFLLAGNLVNQGRIEEAAALTEEMLAFAPESSSGQFYYSTNFAPIDFDGSYGTDDIMNELFTSKALVIDRDAFTLLDDKVFRFIRNSYNAYLKYYFGIRDSDNFLAVMRRAVEIEILLEDAQGIQADNALNEFLIDSRRADLETGIRVFNSSGWDAIKLQ